MMARDAKSLVLAAQGLGPMFAAKDDLAGRIFIPGELQQGIVREMNLDHPIWAVCYLSATSIHMPSPLEQTE